MFHTISYVMQGNILVFVSKIRSRNRGNRKCSCPVLACEAFNVKRPLFFATIQISFIRSLGCQLVES